MSGARAKPRWHMQVPDNQLQQHVPPQLQPLVRGAWLCKAVDSGHPASGCLRLTRGSASGHHHHHHARFCQLSVDLAVLRWGGSRYVLLHLLDSLECDAARLSITLHMLREPALTLCFEEDAPSYAVWTTGLQLAQRLLSGAAAAAHASEGNAAHSLEASKGQQQQQQQQQQQPRAAAGGVEDDSSSMQYHLLLKSALFALHSDAAGVGVAPPTAVANSRHRRCCKDPCAAKLREAQTLAAIVSQQVSSTATSMQPSPVAAMAAAAQPLLPHELAGLSNESKQQEEGMPFPRDVGQQQASQAASQPQQHQAPSDSGSITATPPQQLQHTATALQAPQAQAEQPSSTAVQAGGGQRMLGTFRMPQGLLQRPLSSQAGNAGGPAAQQVHSYGSSLSSGSSLPPAGSCQSSYGGSSRMLSRVSAGAMRPSHLGNATTRQHAGPRLTPQKQQQLLWWLSHQQQQGPSTEGGCSHAGSLDLISAQPSGSTVQEDCSGTATTGAAASETLWPAAGPAHQQHVLTRALSMPELSAAAAAAAMTVLGGSVRTSLEVSLSSSRRLPSTSTGRCSNSGSSSTRPTQEVPVVQQGPVCTEDAAAAADSFAAPPQQQVEAAALASSALGGAALQGKESEPAGRGRPPVRKLGSIKRLFGALADSLTPSSSGSGGSIGDDVGSSLRGAGRCTAEQGIVRVLFAAAAVSYAPRRQSSHSHAALQAMPSFSWPFARQQSASGMSRRIASLTSLHSFSNGRSISLWRPSFDTATISAWSEADGSSITAGGAGEEKVMLEDACVSTDAAAAAAIVAAGSPASAAGLTQHCRARAVAVLTPVSSIGAAEQQEQVQEQQQVVVMELHSAAAGAPAAAGAASKADTVATDGADLERPVSMADLWVYLSGQATAGAGSRGKAPAVLQVQHQEQGQQQRCASPGVDSQQQCPSAWVISTAPDAAVPSPGGALCAAAAAAAAGQPISLQDLAGCSSGCGVPHSLRGKLPDHRSRGGGSQQSCGLQLGLHQPHHQPHQHELWQGDHLDTSSVVKSPAGSHASLHSVFSHTSHASLWMGSHDSGSPASRRAASPLPGRGFVFGGSAAGSHCGSSGSMPRLLEGTGSGMDGPGSRSKTRLLRRGLTLQVPVDVIDWRDLALGRALGQGGEAAVFEARYLDAPVAVKLGVSTSEVEMALAAGSHDNLVGLRGLTTKDDGTLCLVLELCSRGTLDKLLHTAGSPLRRVLMLPQPPSASASSPVRSDRPDLTKLLPLMRSVARGVLHLHTRRPPILHRDIKPANIFLSHGMVVKIGDLGMARQVLPPPPPACSLASQDLAHAGLSSASGSSGSAGRHYCPQQQLLPASSGPATPKASAARTFTPGVVGTITYTAPEVLGVMDELQQREAQDSVETVLKADAYSLGVTLWEMLEVRRPFGETLDSMQLWAQWVSDRSQMVLPPLSVPPEADATERRVLAALQELVTACTAHDPQQRPSMREVLDSIRQAQRLCVGEAAPATGDSSTASVPV